MRASAQSCINAILNTRQTSIALGTHANKQGRVVGINVATAGNQLSFLVPVDRAASLLGQVLTPGDNPPARTLEAVGSARRADTADSAVRADTLRDLEPVPAGEDLAVQKWPVGALLLAREAAGSGQ